MGVDWQAFRKLLDGSQGANGVMSVTGLRGR